MVSYGKLGRDLNKPNRFYLQPVDANLEIVEHFSADAELLKRVNAFGKISMKVPLVIAKVSKRTPAKWIFKTSTKRTE